MDVEKIVEKLKIMLEITSNFKDVLLGMIVEDVIVSLKLYTNSENFSESLVRRIAVIRYNCMGGEGLANESYNGISQTFLNDLPADIKAELKAIRKVKF